MSQTSTGRTSWRILLAWSWRDLKSRWLQVAAIALVIALGTGSYAGLSSVTEWRRASTDDGYRLLNMHDLHAELAQGSTVPAGTLASLALSVDGVAAAEERLILPIQVDASRDGEAILVPGVLIGVPVESGGPQIDGLFAHAGRRLGPEDAG
ncbi:MAG TPA: hypothetical protein PKD27_14560, partial [Tepidiformaceae bacterium]|nr:hypothetical protein [Tepidiformaceae bacterium]